MDFEIFIGRFHPVFVHLPIGFILMAIALEVLGRWKKNREKLETSITVCLGLGALTGIFAIVTGWMLSDSGSYGSSALAWHKWLAVATIAITTIIFLRRYFKSQYSMPLGGLVLAILFGLLSWTGHLGGNLTHGSDYLVEYAPDFIQKIAGHEAVESKDFSSMATDSIVVYRDLVQPMFQSSCYSCHGPEKTSGNLDLSQASLLFEQADSGAPISPGDALGSEVYERITLPPTHKKFMPPNGVPLSHTEIAIIKRWIELGADTTAVFTSNDLSENLTKTLLRDYGLDYAPKDYIEKVQVEPLDANQETVLGNLGFLVQFLGAENNLLDVSFSDPLTEEAANALNGISGKVTILKLSGIDLQNSSLELDKFEHLTRLDLTKSSLDEKLMTSVSKLKHVEVLNLYGSNANLDLLQKVGDMVSLKRLYLANTEVEEDAMASFAEENPNIDIIY